MTQLPFTHRTSLVGSANSLYQDWREIAELVEKLQNKLREVRPHGRDYDGHPTEYITAREEHFELERDLLNLNAHAALMLSHLNR